MGTLIIISGPTASGKTAAALEIAQGGGYEIINGDTGQFYTALDVGTAKPTGREQQSVPHHLFNIINGPVTIDASHYRDLVAQTCDNIWQREKTPIIVGGSLFYLKSLLFKLSTQTGKESECVSREPVYLGEEIQSDNDHSACWKKLNEVDPTRAQKIHPNDSYRIHRALGIFKKTGTQASEFVPKFDPISEKILFIFLCPEPEILKEKLRQRTKLLLSKNSGYEKSWIEECQELRGTKWEEFLCGGNLIGYRTIFKWLEIHDPKNINQEQLDILTHDIVTETWDYVRRQIKFFRNLKTSLLDLKNSITLEYISDGQGVVDSVAKFVNG